MNFKETECP